MTSWHVGWEDSKGSHTVTYSSMSAVMNHVEYSIKHGFKIHGIYTIYGKGDHSQCIFPQRPVYKSKGVELDAEILEVLEKNGQMNVLEIAKATNCGCRTDSVRRSTIRTRMYKLRDKGLVESVPNWEQESIWRLKE